MDLQESHRRLRVVAILHGAERAGLTPLPIADLHGIAYFADALAPVWGLRLLDAQLLKRREGAFSPVLQFDLDRLVGRGVVRPSNVAHRQDADGDWRLEATYALEPSAAKSILDVAEQSEVVSGHLRFVAELVQALSALGLRGIEGSTNSDASYSSGLTDFGGLIDLAPEGQRLNPSARVALRFGSLLEEDVQLTSAEMVHLYVRELYKRLGHAA